jgi:hypothetical protein
VSTIKVDTIKTRAGAVPTANDVGLNIIGTVVQVQTTASVIFSSTSSTTLADLLSLSFTPKFSDSLLKIDVCFRYQEGNTNTNVIYKVIHDTTTIYGINHYSDYHDAAGNTITSKAFHCFLSSTGSTSARTIKFQLAAKSGGAAVTINVNTDTATETRMTVMEIAQ